MPCSLTALQALDLCPGSPLVHQEGDCSSAGRNLWEAALSCSCDPSARCYHVLNKWQPGLVLWVRTCLDPGFPCLGTMKLSSPEQPVGAGLALGGCLHSQCFPGTRPAPFPCLCQGQLLAGSSHSLLVYLCRYWHILPETCLGL